MNKNFTLLVDKEHNVQKVANTVVKFVYQDKSYLVYSIDENDQDRQIFTSELIRNSEGKNFIEDIKEKEKIGTIVYELVMLLPTEYQKGNNPKELIDNISKKYSLSLSEEIPELGVQEYHKNCSIAITKKELVEAAGEFYKNNLIEEKKEEKVETTPVLPTWSIPTPIPEAKSEPIPTAPVEETPAPQVIPNVTPNVVSAIPVEEAKTPTVEPVIAPVEANNGPQPINNINNNIPTEEVNTQNIPNPQMETLAISSDPSLASIGIDPRSTQPNLVRTKTKKAGFVGSKYIIIGTVCLVLAVAVVVAAVILIKQKTNV